MGGETKEMRQIDSTKKLTNQKIAAKLAETNEQLPEIAQTFDGNLTEIYLMVAVQVVNVWTVVLRLLGLTDKVAKLNEDIAAFDAETKIKAFSKLAEDALAKAKTGFQTAFEKFGNSRFELGKKKATLSKKIAEVSEQIRLQVISMAGDEDAPIIEHSKANLLVKMFCSTVFIAAAEWYLGFGTFQSVTNSYIAGALGFAFCALLILTSTMSAVFTSKVNSYRDAYDAFQQNYRSDPDVEYSDNDHVGYDDQGRVVKLAAISETTQQLASNSWRAFIIVSLLMFILRIVIILLQRKVDFGALLGNIVIVGIAYANYLLDLSAATPYESRQQEKYNDLQDELEDLQAEQEEMNETEQADPYQAAINEVETNYNNSLNEARNASEGVFAEIRSRYHDLSELIAYLGEKKQEIYLAFIEKAKQVRKLVFEDNEMFNSDEFPFVENEARQIYNEHFDDNPENTVNLTLSPLPKFDLPNQVIDFGKIRAEIESSVKRQKFLKPAAKPSQLAAKN